MKLLIYINCRVLSLGVLTLVPEQIQGLFRWGWLSMLTSLSDVIRIAVCNVTAEVGANINKFCDITFGISVPNYPSVIVSPTS